MRIKAALFLVSSFLVGSGLVLAQPGEREEFPSPSDHPRLQGRLNLNHQQKKQFEQMQIDMQKQLVGTRARRQTAGLELRQLLNADNLDKAAIERKMNEISQIRIQAATIRLNQWFEVNKTLTPEQQKVWRGVLKQPFRERIRARIRGRFGDGQRPFMGGRPNPLPPQERMMERPAPERK